MKTYAQAVALIVLAGSPCAFAFDNAPRINLRNNVELATADFTYEISGAGLSYSIAPASGGNDFIASSAPHYFMEVRKGAQSWPSTKVVLKGDVLEVEFGGSGFSAAVRARCAPHYVSFEVTAFSGPPGPAALDFVRLPLTLTQTVGAVLANARNNDWASVVLPGNEFTNTSVTRASTNALLTASADTRVKVVGTKAILLLSASKDELSRIGEAELAFGLPHPTLGGVWARQSTLLTSSYLQLSDITRDTIDKAIQYAKESGLGYVVIPDTAWDGSRGTYTINRRAFPQGEADLRAAVSAIHAAGLKAGMHVLIMEVSKEDPLASPIPSEGLLTYPESRRVLAQAIGASDTFISTTEPPEGLNPGEAAAFVGRDLRIGNEIVTYGSLRKTAPYGYAGCVRGAHGTKAEAHDAGLEVANLAEFVGCYRIDPRSSLYAKVAERIGQLLTDDLFDFVYPDGYEVTGLPPEETPWYPENLFVADLYRATKREVFFAHDPGSSYSWHLFTRGNTRDYFTRGFIESFQKVNLAGIGLELANLQPFELGWTGFFTSAPQNATTEPRTIEYAWSKAFAHNAAISLSTSIANLDKSGNTGAVLAAIRSWEQAKSANLPQAVRDLVADPAQEFTIINSEKRDAIFPVKYPTPMLNKCAPAPFDNPFSTQPASLRIEVTPDLAAYGDAENAVLIDPGASPQWISSGPGPALGQPWHSPNVSLQASSTPPVAPSGPQQGPATITTTVTGSNTGADGGWAAIQIHLAQAHDLTERRSLAAWVKGDESGAYLHFTLQAQGTAGGLARDYYVRLDFQGWRLAVMKEAAAGEVFDFHFPYSNYFPLQNFDYRTVNGVYVFLTNIPPGRGVSASFGRLEALKERPHILPDPSFRMNGQTVKLPFAVPSGRHAEVSSSGDALLLDADGHVVEKGKVTAPVLAQRGTNQLSQQDCGADVAVRVRLLGSQTVSWAVN